MQTYARVVAAVTLIRDDKGVVSRKICFWYQADVT
jgi:hypothetical protein